MLNKLWTFAAVRTHHPDLADPSHVEAVLADEGDEATASTDADQRAGAVPGRHDPLG